MTSFLRELRFALRDRVVLLSALGVFCLSSYSLISGLNESSEEVTMIERTKQMVKDDREYYLAKQSDAGGAAYYAFHFTYSPPSPLSYVSRGVRDDLPWKHRIRMLAIEGQIYETDIGNPELSKMGKLDFAFVAAFLLPVLLVLVLFDLRAVELRNNRWAFLSVTAGSGKRIIFLRATIRSLLLVLATTLPLLATTLANNIGLFESSNIVAAVCLNALFWLLISFFISIRVDSGPTVAAVLLACWFAIAVVIPVGGKLIVETAIHTPSGGELLLTQRETVNDAWDLPKEATMEPFLAQNEQWANTAKIEKPFEWKWYYAFQQVGDQTVANTSQTLSNAIKRRDRAMGLMSLLSPSLMTQRALSKAAKTNVDAFQNYEQCVRNFHHKLRAFHYPMLLGDVIYSEKVMNELPDFEPCR